MSLASQIVFLSYETKHFLHSVRHIKYALTFCILNTDNEDIFIFIRIMDNLILIKIRRLKTSIKFVKWKQKPLRYSNHITLTFISASQTNWLIFKGYDSLKFSFQYFTMYCCNLNLSSLHQERKLWLVNDHDYCTSPNTCTSYSVTFQLYD